MKKESKSAYELIPASLVFIKIALQLCAPKTPLVGVEGHKSERTQVNKGFLDEEDTEHFTEKCKVGLIKFPEIFHSREREFPKFFVSFPGIPGNSRNYYINIRKHPILGENAFL